MTRFKTKRGTTEYTAGFMDRMLKKITEPKVEFESAYEYSFKIDKGAWEIPYKDAEINTVCGISVGDIPHYDSVEIGWKSSYLMAEKAFEIFLVTHSQGKYNETAITKVTFGQELDVAFILDERSDHEKHKSIPHNWAINMYLTIFNEDGNQAWKTHRGVMFRSNEPFLVEENNELKIDRGIHQIPPSCEKNMNHEITIEYI
tara:strand:+ start:108 stop:713 length:606 start_codon:yes stop_codon:yes gene_type:complete